MSISFLDFLGKTTWVSKGSWSEFRFYKDAANGQKKPSRDHDCQLNFRKALNILCSYDVISRIEEVEAAEMCSCHSESKLFFLYIYTFFLRQKPFKRLQQKKAAFVRRTFFHFPQCFLMWCFKMSSKICRWNQQEVDHILHVAIFFFE